MELLLSVICYHGDESFLEVWFEQVLTEELKRCPYFSVLSILLNSGTSHPFVESVNFSDLQELSHEGGHSSPRAQMTDLILTYLPSLHGRCTERQLRTAVDFVLRHGSETNNVSFTVAKLINCAGAVADDTLVCQLAADSVIRLVLEQLSASTSGCSVNIVEDQKLFKKEKQRVSEELSNSIDFFLDRSLKKTSALKAAATMLFASIFKSDDKLFAVCIRKMNALARRDDHTALSPAASTIIEAFFDDCLNSLEGLSNVAAIWRDVAAALQVFIVPIKGKSTNDLPHRLCRVLDFVEAPASYSWAWRDVVRLLVLFMSTNWELLDCEEKQQRKIVEKIRTFLSSVLSAVAWKDEEVVRRVSQRWSILFSCWEYIPRSVRPSLMKRLLSEEDLEFLRKLSRRIIVGKVKVDKAVLESALSFYLKYIPSLTDGARQLEEILNWEALVCLQRAGVPLDVALAQLSVGKSHSLQSSISASWMEITRNFCRLLRVL
ncbi:hypothetical protein ANCCAN_08730 [Ancylostoma caninum]|uniref:Uncharacterized protein n=1 Tax=Ancylostoma caninum TaxID=29170 RepID=A0A368GQ94_ANCCA|nr:hypothetical protein ANCCAN_08730 [Ancylostoma caninum]